MTLPVVASSDRNTIALVCGSMITLREVPGVLLSVLRGSLRTAGMLVVELIAWAVGSSVGTAGAAAAKDGCLWKSITLVTGPIAAAAAANTIAPCFAFRTVPQALSFAWSYSTYPPLPPLVM